MKTLLKMREFAAKEFLQNCYCLELLKVYEIFLINDLVICVTLLLKRISGYLFFSALGPRPHMSALGPRPLDPSAPQIL